jgi:hypothetical protein
MSFEDYPTLSTRHLSIFTSDFPIVVITCRPTVSMKKESGTIQRQADLDSPECEGIHQDNFVGRGQAICAVSEATGK